MNPLLLVLSHLGAFLLGAGMWHAITIREGSLLVTKSKTADMQHHKRSRLTVWILILLVASLTLVGFGIQQSSFQDQMNERTSCIEDWGREVITAVEQRGQVSKDLAEAQRGRDDAVDEILLFITNYAQSSDYTEEESPETPPEVRKRYLELLKAFSKAQARLEEAREGAEKVRKNTPYPEMRCNR